MAETPDVRVLAFDTFGTVTDWFTGITQAVSAEVPDVDPAAWARSWRGRYAPILARVEAGELPWQGLDDLQRQTLHEVAVEFDVRIGTETADRLVRAWRTIPAWPDAVDALARLRSRYIVCALSNGSVALLTEMAKHNGFGWDFIGGSDLWRHYKPARETYCGLAELMEVAASQVMMVAAHQSDLDAARSFGLRTAFVPRPLEWGPGHENTTTHGLAGSAENDINSTGLDDLADRLLR